jgi:6-pyruvoyltetrahydropterin/6-carboxytetrahydropterin synthase
MASMPYRVRVERNRLRFAAAHMATFGGQLEPLHGHNYQVAVEVEGDLTDDGWVIDFSDLKSMTQALCDQLDHKFLLQCDSALLEIQETADGWNITFGERRYSLPKSDVALLPLENTMSEQIARWMASRLREALATSGVTNLTSVTIEIEEMPGQWGGWSEPL